MDTVGDSPAKLTTQTELAQYYGTASCSVDPASDGNDRSIADSAEQARQLLEAHQTGGQMLEERMSRTEASVSGFAVRYQPENFSGEDTGWRDWSRVFRTWAGRFQRGRVQEIVRAVEARPGDEATVTELDLRLDDWASAGLKSVAADFYHAPFCKGKALKIVLPDKEGEGFEAWRALVNKFEPTRAGQSSFENWVN